MSLKKVMTGAGVFMTAFALVISSVPSANAAKVPSRKAKAGDECGRAGMLAPGRGAEGSTLTCIKMTYGTATGELRWWYKDLRPLKNLDWVVPANPGGYSQTSTAISESLKKEGLLSTYSSTFRPGAGGTVGLGFFQEIKAKPESVLITGLAMAGGIPTNKSPLKLEASTPVAKVMREYQALVVPATSKYKTLAAFIADWKANPKMPLSGGSSGSTDHQFLGLLAKANGIDPKQMNFVVHSGGPEVIASVLSGATVAGTSGSAEFLAQVQAGKLRVLAISSAKRLPGYPARTLKEQGIDLVYGNWRGVMATADLSETERVNLVRVLDAMRGTATWQGYLKQYNWDDEWAAGKAFGDFLKVELPLVAGVIKDLGLGG
ncbi:MAG: tripartite tricarboxylate transporter substrate binding protein [Actinobacteria bacterium]|jgi:putative tricarboxylic transport membrane protein|nr:tripartite tricarboxylate transporter substrate binding protein [Actinomycetota bacterium]NCX76642.1 tripartite tricarboxylate transporter substrate binding protein [Actinomycetota bacterium]